jgi:hypothetical protein
MNKLIHYRNEQDNGIDMVVIKKENSRWIRKYYAQQKI